MHGGVRFYPQNLLKRNERLRRHRSLNFGLNVCVGSVVSLLLLLHRSTFFFPPDAAPHHEHFLTNKAFYRLAEVAFSLAADDTERNFMREEGRERREATSGEFAIIRFNLEKQSRP